MRLEKKISNQLDQTFRRQNIDNYKKIERHHNTLLDDNVAHKTTDKNAHNSKQIKHDNTTVENMLIYQKERIKNLVVGVDGDGVKEVTDSRVSMDGHGHGLLSERLLHDFNNVNETIDSVNKKFVEINFD